MELKDIQVKLDELKASLLETLTKTQKDEIALQIKTCTDAIEALKLTQVKADDITKLQTSLDEIKAANLANQPVIDAFVANKDKRQSVTKKSFSEAFGEKIEEQAAEFK
jgi:exonuclease I